MQKLIPALILMLLSTSALAAPTRYEMRVDGLACPYCAYGIEKKINALNGVDKDSLDIQLNNGLVVFVADTDAPFSEDKLKTLVNDAGFTLRSFSTSQLQKAPSK